MIPAEVGGFRTWKELGRSATSGPGSGEHSASVRPGDQFLVGWMERMWVPLSDSERLWSLLRIIRGVQHKSQRFGTAAKRSGIHQPAQGLCLVALELTVHCGLSP